MEFGSLRFRPAGARAVVAPGGRRTRRRAPSVRSAADGPTPGRPGADEPVPDPSSPAEPVAVVCVGPAGAGRPELVDALVGAAGHRPPVPAATFLVVRHGTGPASVACVPGHRQPLDWGTGPTVSRPPRRIELTLPAPLLRRLTLVDAPDTGALGLAGVRVVGDLARRGGAVLFVVAPGWTPEPADTELLTELARTGAELFLAVVAPAETGSWAAERCRAALTATLPGFTGVRWFAVDPSGGDPAGLSRALVEWACAERTRRARGPATGDRTVRVLRDAHESDWNGQLDRQVRTLVHRVRQHLALELANIHLRCVQEIVFGSGCAGLPAVLDRELHALSLAAVAECDAAAEQVLEESLARIFGGIPDGGVRQRVAAAVRRGFADHRVARDLDRVLLVTSTGGVASLVGLGALAALDAGPAGADDAGTDRLLPPVGVALSGGCYQLWRNPNNADTGRARSWLQRVLREIELELTREVSRRLEAVSLSLAGVLGDAVDHGILLA